LFKVNSTADYPDINPGDGACRASNNLCTLRAAIDEANHGFFDVIELADKNYNIESQLPSLKS